jgi:hypothetical protein
MIVRTDLCPPGSNGSCALSLLGRNNSFYCNHADGGGAGGGLLFTKLAPHLLRLSDPACGALGPGSFAACLGAGAPTDCVAKARAPLAPTAAGADAASAAGARRRLAAAPGAGADADAAAPPARGTASDLITTLNTVAPSGYGEDLASAAATAHFEKVDNATVTQDPDEPLPTVASASAAPGIPLAVQLRLRDQMGRDVTGSIADASMIMQVRAASGGGFGRGLTGV